MIREIDIWRVAALMVNRYADEAKANSDRRAAELATDGDHAGAVSGVGSQLLLSSLQTRQDHRTDNGPIACRELSRPQSLGPRRSVFFRLTPKVISFLIARTGFGHIDLVML